MIINNNTFKSGQFNVIAQNVQIGSNVEIGNFCIIEEDVEIGDNVTIDDYTLVKKGAKIGNDTYLGTYCKFGKNAQIGNNCRFTSFCEIRDNVVVGEHTSMGSRCTISANCSVGSFVSVKYSFVLTDTPDLTKGNEKVFASVGDRSLIGANVTLMPGFDIGKNCIIGANSQVRDNIPDNEIWFGTPAKFYKKKNN